MNNDYDTIVIGAGIVGVSTARHLQKSGCSVLLLDKKGAAQETSYGNSGVLDTGYILPFAPSAVSAIPKVLLGQNSAARLAYPDGLKALPWIANYYLQSTDKKRIRNGMHMRPLIENAVQDHKDLLAKSSVAKYLKDFGRAKLYRSEKSFQSAVKEVDLLKELGVKCDVYNANEFSEIEPHVNPVFKKAITCEGSGRYTNPQKAIESMVDAFVEEGGHFQIEDVTDISNTNDVWCVNGKHNAKNIVLCAGPWTNHLTKPMGYKFPLAMKRGYHKHYKSNAKISHALVDVEPGYLICPMEQGIRITTGVEFADRATPPNANQINQVLPKARKLIELGDAIEENAWLGSRPCFADSLPVIGKSRKQKGLWFNFGHGHVGLTAGPSSGKLLAQMLTGQKPFCDPTPYNPYRF